MKAKINKVTVNVIQDEPLTVTAAALVNATDPNLSLPEPLAQGGGEALQQQCREIGWCDVGAAVITTAGNLPFEKIIHAVGPRWGEGSERAKLALATLAALRLAEDHKLKSIALPPISTGTLGYPVENCAKVMLEQIIDFTFEDLKHLRTITLFTADEGMHAIFKNEFTRQIEDLKESGDGKVKV